jgi:hypothetical protein
MVAALKVGKCRSGDGSRQQACLEAEHPQGRAGSGQRADRYVPPSCVRAHPIRHTCSVLLTAAHRPRGVACRHQTRGQAVRNTLVLVSFGPVHPCGGRIWWVSRKVSVRRLGGARGRYRDHSWYYPAGGWVSAPDPDSGDSRDHPGSNRGDFGAARFGRACHRWPTALLLTLCIHAPASILSRMVRVGKSGGAVLAEH